MCARFVERGPDQASIYDLQIGPEHFRGKFVSRHNLPLPVDDKGRSTHFCRHLANAIRINSALRHPFPIPSSFGPTYLY